MQRTVNFGDFAVEVKQTENRALRNDTSVQVLLGQSAVGSDLLGVREVAVEVRF
jgi:hypothetical protein